MRIVLNDAIASSETLTTKPLKEIMDPRVNQFAIAMDIPVCMRGKGVDGYFTYFMRSCKGDVSGEL